MYNTFSINYGRQRRENKKLLKTYSYLFRENTALYLKELMNSSSNRNEM